MWKKLREKQRNRQECTTAAAVVRILGGKFLEVHIEELREQVAIAQCEENESHFKYGFSAGLLVQQEAHAQVAQKNKE